MIDYMVKAKEIIRDIKNRIAFQSGDDEECAHYALFRNILVRIALNKASKEIIERHLGERIRKAQIISIVFSDKMVENEEKTFFTEYIFNAEQMTNDDVNSLIRFFQKLNSGEVWTTGI